MHWQRPLTGMERWRWLFDRAAPMNLVFVARIKGRMNREKLRDALNALATRYPATTARIDAAARPRFEATDRQIPLIAEPWRPGAWRPVAVRECNTRTEASTGPLMRARLLDGDDHADLVMTYNQAMADGLSGVHLIDELFTMYGGGARPALVSPEMMAPPLGKVFGGKLAAFQTTLRETRAMRRLRPFGDFAAAAPAQRATALIDAERAKAQITALGKKAATHGTSVHGALAAAMLLAIGDELRGADHTHADDLGLATAVDARRHARLSSEAVGNLLSRVVSRHRVHRDTLFWDLAAAVSRDVGAAVASREAYAYAQRTEAKAIGIGDGKLAKLVAKAEKHNRAAAVINNLGRQEFFRRFGDVELTRLRFIAAANAYVGAALVLSAVTVGDTASLCFTFADPLVPTDRARRVVDATLSYLDDHSG